MSVQQTEKTLFGTGRLYALPAGGTTRIKYGLLNDCEVDFKVDQKEIYGEGGYAVGVADGHRSIDIAVKHYMFDLASFASDNGFPAPSAGAWAYIYDEAVLVAAVTFKYTLAQGALLVPGTVDLVMYVVTGAITSAVTYQFVAAGLEVAGKSASITNVGVITFAPADVGFKGKATYKYTSALGQQVIMSNTFQNSAPFYQMELTKRDVSPIDNSVGLLVLNFAAVRFGGLKLPVKEGEWSNLDRTFKAFADPTGQVGTLTFVNP